MVDRERQVKFRRWAAEEEAAQTEAEIRAAMMKHPLKFSFIFCPIIFSLEFSFRLCKIDFSLEFSFRLTFQISDWLQISFRLVSDW